MIKKLSLFAFVLLLGSNVGHSQDSINVTPDEGKQGTRLDVTISGQGIDYDSTMPSQYFFKQGTRTAGPSKVFFFADIPAADSNTLQEAVILHHMLDTGYYNLVDQSGPFDEIIKKDAFRVLPDPTPPEITGIKPNVAEAGDSLSVVVSGKNTNFDQGTTTGANLKSGDDFLTYIHRFGDVNALSSYELEVHMNFPDTLAGFYDFTIYNHAAANYAIKEDGFFVENNGASAPAIDSIAEDTLAVNDIHRFAIAFTSWSLFEMENPTKVFLEKGDEQISSGEVQIFAERVIDPTFEVPPDADTGHYDLIVMYGGNFEIRNEDAIYMTKESVGIADADPENQLGVKAFPNPFQQTFNFTVNLPEPMHLKAEVLNTSGQQVKKVFDKKVTAGKQAFNDISIDGDLPSGTYLLRLASKNGDYTGVIRLQKQ